MKTAELRKQISIFVPLTDWKAIRHEAARQRIPITELCRRWMQPEMARLRRETREIHTAAGGDTNQPDKTTF